MNILPQSTLRVVRQLNDPFDTDTLYVQAVMRNSATTAILGTTNLTDEGSQRFTGSFFTPPDASGGGYYIDITTSVYTDSGYTNRSQNYAIETHTYHVFQEIVHHGGGGSEVNYEKIRKMLREEIGKIEVPTIPEIRDVTPQILAMEKQLTTTVKDLVGGIRVQEQVNPMVVNAVMQIRTLLNDITEKIVSTIENKEVTPETDITPVIHEIQSIPIQEIIDATNSLQKHINDLGEIIKKHDNLTGNMVSLQHAANEFIGKVGEHKLDIQNKKEEEIKQNLRQLRARRLRLGV